MPGFASAASAVESTVKFVAAAGKNAISCTGPILFDEMPSPLSTRKSVRPFLS